MAKSVKRNFIYNVLYNLLQVIIPIITTPYISRVLGPAGVGVYSFTNTVAAYFVLVAVLGMSTYGVRTTAKARGERELLSQTFWNAYASQLVVGLVVTSAFVLYAGMWDGAERGLYLLWLPLVISSVLDISWFLFGMEDFGFTTLRSLVIRVLGVLAIFAFVRTDADLWKYVLISACIALLNAVALWPRALTYVSFARPQWSEVRTHFLASLMLFIPVVAISLYNSLDKIMLGIIRGKTEVGFYEYAGKLTSLSASVIGAMGTVMLPRVSSVLAEGKKDEAKELVGTSLWLMLAMAMAFSFGLIAVAPVFVPVFFGPEFMPCVSLMLVLATTIPFLSVSNVLGRQWLLPNQGDMLYTRSVCAGAAVDVLLNLFAIPRFGAWGACLSTVVAELTVVLVQASYVKKELPIKRYAKDALPFIVIGFLMLIIIRAVSSMMGGLAQTSAGLLLVELFVGVISYAGFAFGWCIATNNPQYRRVFGDGLRGGVRQRAAADKALRKRK